MSEDKNANVIQPRQSWEVDLFRPEDAEGVARLFHLVYGDGYPVKIADTSSGVRCLGGSMGMGF